MSDVNDGSRWINTELHHEFLSREETLLEMLSVDDVGDSLGEEIVDLRRCSHVLIFISEYLKITCKGYYFKYNLYYILYLEVACILQFWAVKSNLKFLYIAYV